jgi:hypothetical protein
MKRLPDPKSIELPVASASLDLRSPAGKVGDGYFRLLVNMIGDREGQLRRIGGWTRLKTPGDPQDPSQDLNQDLHDQLRPVAVPEVCDLAITVHPQSASRFIGDSVAFSTTFRGGRPPYVVQWFKDGNPLGESYTSAAPTHTLLLEDLPLTAAGDYRLHVTDSATTPCAISTNAATLAISPAPEPDDTDPPPPPPVTDLPPPPVVNPPPLECGETAGSLRASHTDTEEQTLPIIFTQPDLNQLPQPVLATWLGRAWELWKAQRPSLGNPANVRTTLRYVAGAVTGFDAYSYWEARGIYSFNQNPTTVTAPGAWVLDVDYCYTPPTPPPPDPDPDPGDPPVPVIDPPPLEDPLEDPAGQYNYLVFSEQGTNQFAQSLGLAHTYSGSDLGAMGAAAKQAWINWVWAQWLLEKSNYVNVRGERLLFFYPVFTRGQFYQQWSADARFPDGGFFQFQGGWGWQLGVEFYSDGPNP